MLTIQNIDKIEQSSKNGCNKPHLNGKTFISIKEKTFKWHIYQ